METTQERKYEILVVDDNNENIRIIGSILRQNAFQVGFATGGHQALNILKGKDECYDLVLLDINMPDMNGIEVCKLMRKDSGLKELPVIFLTANSEPENIIEGFASGGQDYVTKPFHAGELLSRIKTHIELKENRQQLKQMNAILEEKVKERTKELEQANKNLEAANIELEKLDGAKVEFLQIISHEINTPLNGIMGFAEILKDKLQSTEYFRFFEILYESANRLYEFTKTSIFITNLRTTPENFEKKTINVCNIIKKVIKDQQIKLNKQNINLNFNCKSEKPITMGNEYLIHECITQLIKNAIQYSPKGQPVYVDIYNEKNKLLISIEDCGPGFSDQAIRSLFKPFAPGEKHVDKNKGLGLYLVKMIIEFHHAQIEISNKSNFGARIVLSFNAVES